MAKNVSDYGTTGSFTVIYTGLRSDVFAYTSYVCTIIKKQKTYEQKHF